MSFVALRVAAPHPVLGEVQHVFGARFATPLMALGLMCPPMGWLMHKKR